MNLLIDASSIVKYENIALWVLFGLVLFVLLFSIFRGAFRGCAYGTYRLIFFAIVITVLFLTLGKVTEAIGNIDLSKWISQSINLTISDKTITAPVTSVSGTITALIEDAIKKFDMNVDPTNLAQMATGLTQSLLKVLMIFIYGILLWTVGKFLCWILWHAAFKFIIPKSKRKLTKEEKTANDALPRRQRKKTIYQKVRGVSMVQEVVINLLLLSMLIVPISGTINSIANSFNGTSKESTASEKLKADNDTLNTIQTALDTYQNSVFSKAFFGWTVNQEGKSWDTQLLSFLSKSNVTKDMTISVIDVVSEAAGIGKEVIESGLLSEEGTTFDKIYLLLTTEYGVKIISTLANSELVTSILPMALEFATNIDTIKNYIGNSLGIDYYGYNWSATVEELGNMITDLQSSDIFTFFTDENGEAHFDTDSVASIFSENSKKAMNALFERFAKRPDEKNLFSDLITVFLVNYALNSTSDSEGIALNDFLPSTDGCEYETDDNTGRKYISKLNEDYENLSLGDELQVVYGSLCDINDLDDRLTALIVDSLVDEEKELDTDVLIDIVVDNIDEINEIIVGKDDMEEGKTCLLDCSFITYGMGAITDLIGSSVSSALNVEIDMSGVRNELFSETLPFETRKANAKSELGGMLNLIKSFVNADPICKEFIKDLDASPGIVYEPNGNLHSIEDGLLDGFIALSEGIDDSKILTAILPKAAESLLSNNEALKELGIDGLNTDVDGFGKELAKLLKVAKECMPLIQFVTNNAASLSGASSKEISEVLNGLADYHDQMVTLLNGICANKIINDENNTTYRNLLQKLLGNILGREINLPADIDPSIENVVVADLIYGLGKNCTPTVLNALLNGGSVSLSDLGGVDFAEILKPLDSSDVFGDIIADLLDDAIVPLLGSSATDSNLSFKNVTSWQNEGDALNSIIKFGAEIGDISNIDLFNSDPDAISSIIKALSQSQIFNNKTSDGIEYTFGKFFYKTIIDSLGDSISFFEDKDPNGKTAEERTQTLCKSMSSLSQSGWDQEAEAFGDILANLNKVLNGSSLSGTLNIKDIKAAAVKGLLKALKTSTTIGRPISYHLYEQIATNLIDAGIDIGMGDHGYMNIDWIWDAFESETPDAIYNEMYYLSLLIETVLDPSYGLLDDSGNISSDGLDLSKMSGKYMLTPLTKSMAKSIVFNTIPDGETTPTAFENLLTEMIADSGIYGTNDEQSKAEILEYVQNVSPGTQEISEAKSSNRLSDDGPWNEECEALGNLGDSINELGISISDFSPSSIFKNSVGELLNEQERETKRLALNDVVSAVNDSKILYHLLPNLIKTGIDSVASSLGGSATPNYYYMGKGINADPYGKDEIENLTYIIYYAAQADLSVDINELDIDSASEILTCLAKSHIFNSVSNDETSNETFFQSVMADVYSKDEIANYYYRVENPKDNPEYNKSISYTDSRSKAIETLAELFPAMETSSSCDSQKNLELLNGDSNSLKSFVKVIQDNKKAYEKITSNNVMELDSETIKTIFKELSGNKLFADILVNALGKTFSDGFASSMIDMSNANPYYCYWLRDDGTVESNDSEADFTKTIGDDEIDVLADFIPFFNENSKMFDDLSSLSITSSTIETFKSMLNMLNDSYIFHNGLAWDQMGTKVKSSWQSDLTVFEQAYGLIIKESGLADMNYSSSFDAKYASAEEKLNDYIKSFTAGKLVSSHSKDWKKEIDALTTDGKSGGALNVLLNLGVIGEDGMSAGSIDLMSFSPDKLSKMLKALNGIDIVKEVVPYKIKDTLSDTIDFSSYSSLALSSNSVSSFDSAETWGDIGIFSKLIISGNGAVVVSYTSDGSNWKEAYNGSLAGSETITMENAVAFKIDGSASISDVEVDTANYFLSQETYGEDDGAIDSLTTLLNSLYLKNGGSYPTIDSSDPDVIETLLGSITDILVFIDDDNGFYARGFDEHYKSIAENESFLSRDVFMRNMLKVTYTDDGKNYDLDIGNRFAYPLGDIHDIFESDTYDANVEGNWFSNQLKEAEKVEFILSGNIGEITSDGKTLPLYHSKTESLAGLKNDAGDEYVFETLIKEATTSQFGSTIVDNMARSFLLDTENYAVAGVYFKEGVVSDPNDDEIRKSSSTEAKEISEGYRDSFKVVEVEADKNTLIRMLKVTEAYGIKAFADGTSSAADFKTLMSEMDDNNSIIDKFFYNAAIYDYMVNRGIYHGEIEIPSHMDKISIPNAFATDFTFASVGALAN